MAHATDDYSFELGFYVIGVFDVLGQRSRLIEPISFPPTTEAESRRADENLERTVVAVDRFRQLFRRQFEDRRRALAEEASQVPAPLRARFEASLQWNLVDWGMSDTWCVAVRLARGSGAAGATAAMVGIRRLIEAAAATWLMSLATAYPIRGGMEIGAATQMREGDVYGAALVEAYRLESEVAGGPRIVLGEQLVECLQDARWDPDVEGAARVARDCSSLLRRDPSDWRTVVDVLGSWARPGGPSHLPFLREAFVRAYRYVRHELRRHEQAGQETLAARYRALLAYFDERAADWQA